MADGSNRDLSQATVVETVLRAVYGRGEVTAERTYEVPLDLPDPEALSILGTHAANQTVQDVAIISTSDGRKKLKATGTFELLLWVKAGAETQVVEGTLTFSEDIPLHGPSGMAYQNEEASARFQGAPRVGKAALVQREGRTVAVVPVTLSLAGEMAGDARIFIYARPSPP